MTRRELDKVYNLSGKWRRYCNLNNEAGIVCRCIYDHLREYYFLHGVDDKYVSIVCALEDLLPPGKLFVFITLGLDDVVDNKSLIGRFVHGVLIKHRELRPDIYKFIDDMDIGKKLDHDSVIISGMRDEIYKDAEHE